MRNCGGVRPVEHEESPGRCCAGSDLLLFMRQISGRAMIAEEFGGDAQGYAPWTT